MAFDLGGQGRAIRPTMNVTPLVDVVLVLLIIFMVVTPMLQKQVWLHVPPKPAEEAPLADSQQPPIVLTVTAAGLTSINGTEVPRPELAEKLERLVASRADKVVFFDAAEALPYEDAVAVLDLLKGQKIEDVAVLAEPLSQN